MSWQQTCDSSEHFQITLQRPDPDVIPEGSILIHDIVNNEGGAMYNAVKDNYGSQINIFRVDYVDIMKNDSLVDDYEIYCDAPYYYGGDYGMVTCSLRVNFDCCWSDDYMVNRNGTRKYLTEFSDYNVTTEEERRAEFWEKWEDNTNDGTDNSYDEQGCQHMIIDSVNITFPFCDHIEMTLYSYQPMVHMLGLLLIFFVIIPSHAYLYFVFATWRDCKYKLQPVQIVDIEHFLRKP